MMALPCAIDRTTPALICPVRHVADDARRLARLRAGA
jgi:hypothetical protein